MEPPLAGGFVVSATLAAMIAPESTTSVRPMAKKRLRTHMIILMCMVAAFYVFYFSPWWMSLATGQPVASYTISVLQPVAVVLFVSFLYMGVFLGAATLMQHAFAEKAFPWFGSRVAALFWLFYLSAVLLTAFMMGSLPSSLPQ